MGKQRKKYTEEQITQLLKEAEVSNNVSDTLRKYGVNDSSYYRWKAKYGGMESKSILRLRELERENAELRARLDGARQRTLQLVNRMRFLRQQQAQGER